MSIVDPSLVLLELGLSSSATQEEEVIVQEATTRASGAVKKFLRYDPVQRVRTEYYPLESIRGGTREFIWEANSSEAFQRRETEASTSELQVRHTPVRYSDEDGNNTIDLRIDYDGRNGAKSGAFAAATQKTEGTDFWPNYDGNDSNSIQFCSDGIFRSIGLWPLEPGSVKITYVGGYTDDELAGADSILDASPITESVVQEAVIRAKKALLINKKNGSLGFVSGPLFGERLGDYSYQTDVVSARMFFGGKFDLQYETKYRLQEFTNYGLYL